MVGWHLSCVLAVAASAVRTKSPSWGAMVINLERRRDRLVSFADAMNHSEPWLFNSKKVCRVSGRDGLDLLNNPSTQDGKNVFLAQTKQPADDVSPMIRQRTNVPKQLDEHELTNDGWLTFEATRSMRNPDSVWPSMTAGGVGLFLGHAEAWKRVVVEKLDYGIVFEDDLNMYSKSFASEVSAVLANADDASWDLLYLQTNSPSWPKNHACPYRHATKSKLDEVTGLVPNTAAYIVTQLGARKLLSGAFPATKQLDAQLSLVPDLRRVAMSPMVAQCDERHGSHRDTDVQEGAVDSSYKKLSKTISHFADVVADVGGHGSVAPPSPAAPIPDC